MQQGIVARRAREGYVQGKLRHNDQMTCPESHNDSTAEQEKEHKTVEFPAVAGRKQMI